MDNRRRGILATRVAKARQQFMAAHAPAAAANRGRQPKRPMELADS